MSAPARSRIELARRLVSRHALLIIVGVGASVRFATLDQGIWSDELLAIQVITREPHEMLSRIIEAETNPPLYFIVLAGWERVFGDGEFALRSLSALLGTATIPVVYAAGAALGSRRVGLVAGALTAASPLMIWYSQEVRPYALFAFLAALAFLCFVELVQGKDRRWLWGWAIASILAFNAHYFGALPVAVEAGFLLWWRRDLRLEIALASATIAAAALTLVPLAAAQVGLTSWFDLIDVEDRLLQLPAHFLLGMNAPWGFVAPLVVVGVLSASAFAVVRADPRTRRVAAIAGVVVLAGLTVVLVGAAVGSDYVNSRNLIELWAPFAIAVGALLAAPALGRIGPALVAGLCAIGVGLALWTAFTASTARPDWDELAAALGPSREGRAIVTRSGLNSPLGLYLEGGGRDAVPGESVTTSELEVIELVPADDHNIGPCWWLVFCGGESVFGPTDLPFEIPPEFELVGEGTTSTHRYQRYRAPAPVTLPPVVFGGVLVQSPS